MNEEENIIDNALSDESQLNSADASSTVGSVPSDTMSLSELNQYLGKNFSNKETAFKALKDTFSYVGKKREDIQREVISNLSNENRTDQLAKELEEMRKERFYDKNPQYSGLRSVIEKAGGNPSEVVNQDWFKEISTKVSGYDESQKLRTVLESNPRLNSSRDSLSKAREAQAQGGSKEQVENLATRAVLDAYGM